MKPGIRFYTPFIPSDPANWIPSFPNPADFRFDYFKLLQASPDGLATFDGISEPKRVAVIGAGAAGMTVARELHRCGCDVTIFEASGRIGGRLYTVPNPNGFNQASMEMGAMRLPFFNEPNSNNSILGYYMNYEVAGTNPLNYGPFPNPGAAPGNTGIYINNGYGPDMMYPTPTLIPWPDGQQPDNPQLQLLNAKATLFGSNFQIAATMYYSQPGSDWETCWNKIVEYYDPYTFGDLVLMPAMSKADIEHKLSNLQTFDGNLGGMGMTTSQSDLLATIGTGDGSWGAFFTISALWFMRCTYFGFSSNLQTIEGYSNPASFVNTPPPYYDATGTQIPTPTFEGIQALPEYLYFANAPGNGGSLYENAQLYLNSPVSRIVKQTANVAVFFGPDNQQLEFDDVVLTTTQWAAQMAVHFEGFDTAELPQAKVTARNTQHNISSCKLFFPLNKKYWLESGNLIPQIIITDTFVQDMYGLNWTSKADDKGVLLASYTWEDDSLKLLPFDIDKLSALVLAELKRITMTTVGQDIVQYIDHTQPVTIQWISEQYYIGCSKLYRTRNQAENELDLSYNQDYSADSHLYFAGENYSVEGGWTEPALRSGMDCVMQYLNNNGATFSDSSFDFAVDYPKWQSVSQEVIQQM